MRKREFTYAQKLAILRRLADAPKPSQEVVGEEVHCAKRKIGEVLKEFRGMPWEEAKALCGGDERVLALRPDYVEQRIREANAPKVVDVAGKTYVVGHAS